MQGDFRDLYQIEVFPLDTVALAVDDLQVPVGVLFAIFKSDLHAIAVRQSVFAKYVLFPLISRVGRDVDLVNLNTGAIVQNKILFARARIRGRNEKNSQHAERKYDS